MRSLILLIMSVSILSACERRVPESESRERRRQEEPREEKKSEFAGEDIQLMSNHNWFRFENKEVVCYEANKSGVWCYRKEIKNENPSN